MALTKYKLGDLIQESFRKNENLFFGISYVRGISNSKQITETKASVDSTVIRKFYVVKPGEFIYNPRTTRIGDKVGLVYNNGNIPLLFSFNNIAFYIRETAKNIIIPEYLYMFFNRSEFDRYAMINGWGSATELFSFSEMCNLTINLPPYPVQQKYVDIYNAMLANQQSYEHGLDDLKLTCDAYIEKCKTSSDYFSLSELIEEFDERNTNLICNAAFGVNKEKQFMPTVASGDDLSKYKVVRKGQFACNLMHVGRDITIPVAFNNSTDFLVVSPAYLTFQTKSNLILPEYLLMWLSRDEIGRYAWYLCDASIRGSMEKKRFLEIAIPVPPIKEQQALVELFSALSIRKELLNKLRLQVKSLCPILIKGSIEEGMRTNEA